MKTSRSPHRLMESGREDFERTDDFHKKIVAIRNDTKSKYAPLIAAERHIFGKLLLWIKMTMEISRKIRQLSSTENLHFAQH